MFVISLDGWRGRRCGGKESRLTRKRQDVLDIEAEVVVSCRGVVVEAGLESLNVGLELATRAFLSMHDCSLVAEQVQELEGVGEAEERVRGREHLLSFELDGEGAVGGCGRMRWVQRVELGHGCRTEPSTGESVQRIERESVCMARERAKEEDARQSRPVAGGGVAYTRVPAHCVAHAGA